MDENIPDGTLEGLSRRDMLRRSALVGGTVVWMAPAVQTLAAPAFAAGSTAEENPPGAISYVIVFFACGSTYYRVKYSEATSGYTAACGEGASVGNVSNDEAGFGAGKYNDIVTALGNPTFATGCPDATFSAQADGDLQIDLGGDCSIVGWLLHDGSCQAVAGGTTKFRWAGPTPVGEVDAQDSGPSVPTAVGGTFEFDDCI